MTERAIRHASLSENTALKQRNAEARDAGIRRARRLDPEVTIVALAKRFRCESRTVVRVLAEGA